MGNIVYMYVASFCIGVGCAALQPKQPRSIIGTLCIIAALWCTVYYVSGG